MRNARAICEDEGGCKAKDKPCCLFKVKEIWSSAGFPMKERDDHIMRVLNKITKKHADKKKAFSSARLKEEDNVGQGVEGPLPSELPCREVPW